MKLATTSLGQPMGQAGLKEPHGLGNVIEGAETETRIAEERTVKSDEDEYEAENDDKDEEENDDEHEDEDDDEYAEFRQVADEMNINSLSKFATSLRRLEVSHEVDHKAKLGCTIDLEPMFGSFNMLFAVIFDDGVQWLFKVPAEGCAGRWTTSAAQGLRSEAGMMRLLKHKTSIPIPKIFAFDASLKNQFGCPFILMERIRGEPLFKSESYSFSLG